MSKPENTPDQASVLARRHNGRWVAGGSSPNPGGRPQAVRDVAAAAREHTIEALGVLVSVMRDTEAPHNARLSAAGAVLDRAVGKPAQSMAIRSDAADVDDQERRAFAATLIEAVRSASEGLGQVEIL